METWSLAAIAALLLAYAAFSHRLERTAVSAAMVFTHGMERTAEEFSTLRAKWIPLPAWDQRK